jgi:hypothetical protein
MDSRICVLVASTVPLGFGGIASALQNSIIDEIADKVVQTHQSGQQHGRSKSPRGQQVIQSLRNDRRRAPSLSIGWQHQSSIRCSSAVGCHD